jgi:hypothetical protein
MIRSWLKQKLAVDVVVHTTDSSSIRGLLEDTARDGVVLRAARYLEGGSGVPLGGELFIPREKILMVQVDPGVPDAQ